MRIACFTFADMIAGLEEIRLDEYLSIVSEYAVADNTPTQTM